MNPLGIALTFLMFGLLIGAGFYLSVQSLGGLRRNHAFGLSFVAQAETHSLRGLAAVFGDTLVLLVGLAFMYVGVAWTYIVVFR